MTRFAPDLARQREEIDVLARTLYGEARGERLPGIEAVASVVLNRVRRGGWWGRSVVEVCRFPWQFSCWNPRDPNRAAIEAAVASDPSFAICLRVARRALAGLLPDTTHGATHYHATSLLPRWAEGKVPCAEIGRHLFYNDVE